MPARSDSGASGVARIHFGARGGFQAIEQIVGFYAQAFAAAHFHVRFAGSSSRERVAHLGGAARRERHNLVREMNRACRFVARIRARAVRLRQRFADRPGACRSR